MQSIQALREKHDVKAKEIDSLMNDVNHEDWTAEHTEKYDALMLELDAIKDHVDRQTKYIEQSGIQAEDEQLQESINKLSDGNSPRAQSLEIYNKWMRGGDNAVTADEWAIYRNTMSTTTGSEGGNTVQTDVAESVMEALKDFGGMRKVATVIVTDQGNDINYPQSDGTAEVGEIIGENATATDLDPSFGVVTLKTQKYSSKVTTVPFELLQDSQIDVEAYVTNRQVQRIGRITNQHFTTGTGTAQPNGIVTASTLGKAGATGQTTSVIFDDLIDLEHSVDNAYRDLGRCSFMLSDSAFKAVKKLKDSQNRPIFIPGYDGLAGPVANTILGYPVTINNDVAAMAANAKSILFGDFSFYLIRDVMAMTMFRFTDSVYSKKGQVGFLMWSRHGGQWTDIGGAVKFYQNSAT